MFVQRILPAILVVVPAALAMTADGTRSEPAVEACKTKPGLVAARGTHWYFRRDHVTNRHCWYLGLERIARHTNTNASEASAVAPAVPTPPQKPAEVQTVPAAQWQAAAVTSPELAATAAVPLAELSARQKQDAAPDAAPDAADFAARWPDLPKLTDVSFENSGSENQSGAGASKLRSSYADKGADDDAMPDVPLAWPVVEAVAARPGSPTAGALEPLYLAGGAVMALLFLAGWTFGHVRGRRIHVVAGPIAAEPGPSRPDGHAPHIESAVAAKTRSVARVRRPTPTDPAQDLRTSLGELMRDLQRAGAAAEARPSPVRKPKRRAAATQNARLLEVVD